MPVIVFLIVATPFAFAAWVVDRVLRHRVEVKAVQAGARPMPALPASPEVEQRLANLEAIICSTDYEVAARFPSSPPHRAA